MTLKFEPLSHSHNRVNFDCGEEALNLYLSHFARQDMSRELARTFIIRKEENDKVLGYYTLCSGAVDVSQLPDHILKKLPKYPIPVARLARLAVDRKQQSKGYGELLLIDALYRVSRAGENMGIYGMVIDAKHETAKRFYQQYGFETLSLNPLLLFACLKDLRNKFLS
jgi:GNAT superfamily N-acetyltransferase